MSSEPAETGPCDVLARAVLDACRARGIMLVAAESCTGGMIAAALTDIAGSSDVVDRAELKHPSIRTKIGRAHV